MVIHCPIGGSNGFILDRFIYRLDVEPKILLKIDINDPKGNPVRTCIPQSMVKDVLQLYHDDNSHKGVARTYLECKSQVYWPGMQREITEYVNRCEVCVRAKTSSNKRVKDLHLMLPPQASHTWAIDLVGGLPRSGAYNQILVCVCTFSRYTVTYPMSSGAAAEIIMNLTICSESTSLLNILSATMQVHSSQRNSKTF